MKYVKAIDVLPQEIIEIIQNYVDGEYLYIPRKNDNKKSWGEKSGIKNILKERNIEIYEKYIKGLSISELSKEYFLSEKSIRKIVSLYFLFAAGRLLCSSCTPLPACSSIIIGTPFPGDLNTLISKSPALKCFWIKSIDF